MQTLMRLALFTRVISLLFCIGASGTCIAQATRQGAQFGADPQQVRDELTKTGSSMTQDTGEHTGPQLPQQSQAHPTNAETDSIRIDADRSYTDAAGTTVHPFMEITCKPNSDYYHRLTVDFYTGVLAVDSPVVIKIGDLEASQLTFMTLEDRKTITFLDRLPNSEISRLSSAQLIGVFAVKGSVVLAFQPFLEKESVGVAFDTSKLLTTARDSHPSCSQLLSDEITTQTGQREGEERFPLRLEISSECETFAFIQYRVDDGTEESGHFAPALRRNIVDLPVTLEAKQKIVVSTSYGYTVAHLVFRLNGQPVQPEWKTTDKGKVIRLNPRPTRAGPCSSAVPDNKNAEVVFQGQQSK